MLQREFTTTSLIDQCALALRSLYDGPERNAFLQRLDSFLVADKFLMRVVQFDGDNLRFETESFLPPVSDPHKPNLFFIVGNPAPESVALRAMYAYEGGGVRQHRFWKVMHSTGVLRFSKHSPDCYSPDEKMEMLYRGDYSSPFNVHVIPFYSLPSPPGGKWGGVAGLQRLFGKKFAVITQLELQAVKGLLTTRVHHGDSVLVLQKDAYTALGPPDLPKYDVKVLRTGALRSNYLHDSVQLLCLPPTRLLYSQTTKSALESLVLKATGESGMGLQAQVDGTAVLVGK